MIDANQVWEVDEAIRYVRELSFAKPWFIEEPTSPDDVEGHRKIREAIAPVKVATGEGIRSMQQRDHLVGSRPGDPKQQVKHDSTHDAIGANRPCARKDTRCDDAQDQNERQ